MTILEGFNVHAILIGIAFVIYFAYIGRAIKMKVKWINLPSTITGLLVTMFIWSASFLVIHINPVNDYKMYYILYIGLSLGLASLAKPWIGFKFDKLITIYISLAVIGTIITGALLPEEHTSLFTDNWLYMDWMAQASEFMSDGLKDQHNLEYGLSSFYRFFGSFFGMMGHTIEYIEGGYRPFRVFQPVFQTATTILVAVLSAEVVKFFINDKRYHLVMPSFVVSYWLIGTYGTTIIGSYLLWIPCAYLFAYIYRKEYEQRNLILITIPFIFFTSSIFIIFTGFVVMNTYFVKDKNPYSNYAFALALVTKNILGTVLLQDNKWHFILAAMVFTLFTLNNNWIRKVVSKIVWFISYKPYWTQWIIFVLILIYNFMDLQDNSFIQTGALVRRGIMLKFVMVALLIEWKRGNKDLFIAICLMAILNLPYMELLNWISNNELDGIMHRFGQLLLMGDRYSIVHWAFTIPVFGWLMFKELITKEK